MKKGQAGIITVVLLILLILGGFVTVANVVFSVLESPTEQIPVKTRLQNIKYEILDVFNNGTTLNITIRGDTTAQYQEENDILKILLTNKFGQTCTRTLVGVPGVFEAQNYAIDLIDEDNTTCVKDPVKYEIITAALSTRGNEIIGQSTDTLNVVFSCGNRTGTVGSWSDTIYLDKFDEEVGTLQSANLLSENSLNTNLLVENLAGGSSALYNVNLTLLVNATGLGFEFIHFLNFVETDTLSPYDGTLDFGGTSGVTIERFDSEFSSERISSLDSVSGIGETISVIIDSSSTAIAQYPPSGSSSLQTEHISQVCMEYKYRERID